MSINGINVTSGAARIAAPTTADAGTTVAGARAAAATASASRSASASVSASAATKAAASSETAAPGEVKQEQAQERQTLVHFPWLSRLSVELEAASNRRGRFPTQIMGDHLDKKA